MVEKYDPLQEAYNILLSWMNGETNDEGLVIETALGYLGEALE